MSTDNPRHQRKLFPSEQAFAACGRFSCPTMISCYPPSMPTALQRMGQVKRNPADGPAVGLRLGGRCLSTHTPKMHTSKEMATRGQSALRKSKGSRAEERPAR